MRPNGEARTRLAQAYLRAGRIGDAKHEIETVLASRWKSGDACATAALVFEAAHDTSAAQSAEAKARAWSPPAIDGLTWLRPSLQH